MAQTNEESETLNDELATRSALLKEHGNILRGATVYLSGPMDFVADRSQEAVSGWRSRVSQFLNARGVIVYNPFSKPTVSGLPHYGKEDENTNEKRNLWRYDDTDEGRAKRAELCELYWPTLHIDLRMTDLADFIIAYCPTNTYSVGTVHEVAMARQQHKPVLLVTPRLEMSKAQELQKHLEAKPDKRGLELLKELRAEAIIRPNPNAIPSLWYMAMLESEDYFFDGFGFADYMEEMGWQPDPLLDNRERLYKPTRPLLHYIDKLNSRLPKTYNRVSGAEEENADWLVFVEDDVVQKPSQ